MTNQADEGKIIYNTPAELGSLTSEQRRRVLHARAEQAKDQAATKLLAFADRAHPNQHGSFNFFCSLIRG